MKHLLCLLLILLSPAVPLSAQSPDGPPAGRPGRERIEQAKIAMITSRLDLTVEQAQAFWPVYNEFSDRRREHRKQMHRLRRTTAREGVTDAQVEQQLRKFMALRREEVDIEERYMEKMLTVISPGQVAELYEVEHDFVRQVMHRLDRDRPGQRRGGR
ncbi:MAG: Spy/CpxP family protein refolding chaperone [Catalinimonas sp.]